MSTPEELIKAVAEKRSELVGHFGSRVDNIMDGVAFVKQVIDTTIAAVLDVVQSQAEPVLVSDDGVVVGEVPAQVPLSQYYFEYISTLEKLDDI